VGCCENLRDKINVSHILLKFENIENGWREGRGEGGRDNKYNSQKLSQCFDYSIVTFQDQRRKDHNYKLIGCNKGTSLVYIYEARQRIFDQLPGATKAKDS
jgi:hypothetical protein